MNRKYFDYDVNMNMEFTGADLRVLMYAAEHHYDSKCKSYAREGGLLYGLRNRILVDDFEKASQFFSELAEGKHDALKIERILNWSELDTLAKICEMYPYYSGENQKRMIDISWEIRRSMKAIKDEEHSLVERESKLRAEGVSNIGDLTKTS